MPPTAQPLALPAPLLPPVLELPDVPWPSSRAFDWASWHAFQAGSKSHAFAVLQEIALPGMGSMYAESWLGAATTWGLTAGGIGLVAWGIGQALGPEDSGAPALTITAGALLMVGGRVYGVIDSYRATTRYNLRLARRLGLHGNVVLGPVPLRQSGQTGLGLGAAWRF